MQGRRRNFPRDTTPFDWRGLLAPAGVRRPGAADAGADHRLPALRHRDADRGERDVDAVRAGGVGAGLPRPDLGQAARTRPSKRASATGVVLLVIMASSVRRLASLTYEQMPAAFTQLGQGNAAVAVADHPAMNLIMLVLGMFIDLPAAVLLLTPMFVPLAAAVGMDTMQLGIMMIVNLAIGLYTRRSAPRCSSPARSPRCEGRRRRCSELVPFYVVAIACCCSASPTCLAHASAEAAVLLSVHSKDTVMSELLDTLAAARLPHPALSRCAWARCRARATSARPWAGPTCWPSPTATR